MTEADKIYVNLLQQILTEGEQVNTRNSLTTSHFNLPNVTFTEFPLVTLKKTAVKKALMEMEYFLKGGTHLDDLAKEVHPWWEYACTVTPKKMHFSYGHSFRRLYRPTTEIIEVSTRTYQDSTIDYNVGIVSIASIEHKGRLTGEVYPTSDKLDAVRVLGVTGLRNTNTIYQVQFLSNGYLKEYRADVIKAGRMKNPYTPSVYGIGFFGEVEEHPKKGEAQQVWFHMIGRCFNKTDQNYKNYGGKGITVCKRWLNFANFINDISKLDGYEYWLKDTTRYALDKDHYGATVYSPDTCIFLPRSINTKYAKSLGKFVLEKDGEFKEFLSRAEVASFLGISCTAVVNQSRVFNATGYTLTFVKNTEEYNFRFKLLLDQLSDAVECIRNNPYSRRNIITTWIPEHVQSGLMNPTNCHNTMTQFFVRQGKLHMKTYARSQDMLLGTPHNWAQSWAFLLYLAYHTNLQVGSMTWMWGDAHIYEEESHREAVDVLIKEDTRCAHWMVFDKPISLAYQPENLRFDSNNVPIFKAEDFKVIGEIPEPAVKHKIKLI